MGRQRKHPVPEEFKGKRIYRGPSAWNYHPRNQGEGPKTIRLAPIDASPLEVLAAYEAKLKEMERPPAAKPKGTVADLVAEFFTSPTFTQLAKGTQGQYQKNARTILKVFGKTPASKVEPQHVRKFMDLRGQQATVTANRELAFFSRLYAWAYERGKVPSNPCKGVRRFTETARERYISDAEYLAVLAQADDTLRAIIEIAYCCAARVSDVLKIERKHVLEEGLFIKQGKTGKAQIKGWTPRLRAAIEVARRESVQHTRWILTNSHGNAIQYDTFRTWWTTAKNKAAEANPELQFDFTFHDVKAKSISDWDGDKQKFSGHKTQSQVAVYDRKVPIVGAHE